MKADRYIIWVFPVIFAIFSYVGCTSKRQEKEKDTKDKVASEREQKTSDNIPDGIGSLGDYDISSQSPEKVDLPSELIEVSGITFTDDNRLFAHGDEDGDVFEIDVSTGKIIKRFHLGSWLVIKGDFEDIAYAKGKFYLVESKL